MSSDTINDVFGQVNKTRVKTSFEWVISDYPPDKTDRILSPVFFTCVNGVESKWQLYLYPEGSSPSTEKYASIFIKHLSDNTVYASIRFAAIDKHRDVLHEKKMCVTRFDDTEHKWGYSKFVKQKLLANKCIDSRDELTIICEIILKEGDNASNVRTEFTECLRDYEKLLNNEKSSDVIFKFGKKKLYAHKIILSARSTYFAAMFEHNMLEKTCSIVEITDISHEVFKEIFKFLYVGKLDKLEEMVDELFIASNKYCLDGLKTLCENFMVDNLTIENAFRYFIMGNAFHAPNLQTEAVEFIKVNAEGIIDTKEYKLYEKSHPLECCELLRRLVFKKTRY